jgi:O-antigen/teichoic acid export membrane protein
MGDLWRSIGFTTGARVYSLVAGLVGLVITARVLGPSGRGLIATATTWALLFSTFGCLSLGQVAIHRATGKDPSEWLGSVLTVLLVMTGAVTLVGWIVATVIYLATDGEAYGRVPVYALVLGFATLPFLVWEQYGSSLLMALGRISVYNRAEIVGRSVGVALVVVLVALAGAGVAGALVALIVAQAMVAAAGLRYLIRRAGTALALSRAALREMLVGGAKLHLNAVGTFLFTGAAILIVQSIRGPAETGAFQVVAQLMNVALIVPQAAAMVLYGEVARLGPDSAWLANRRVLLRLLPVIVAAALIGSLLAPTLLPLVLGDDFSSAVPIFQLLAFALVGQATSAIMAPQWIGRGLFWQASAITVALGIANVIACFPLVYAYGMKGAAYSLFGVSAASVIVNGTFALWVNRRAASEQPPAAPETQLR